MFFRDVVWGNSDLEMLVHSPIPDGRTENVSFWGWPDQWKSWNWEGNEGKPLLVSVYSRCDSVRLELNGKELETQQVSEKTNLTAQFEVPYQPGELVAVGLKDGKEVARQTLKTAGEPFRLKITEENNFFPDIINELIYFNVEVLDENGLLVPNAEIQIELEITGNGKLQAVASENPKEMQSFQQPRVKSYRGKCQLIVKLDKPGAEINITAKSDGLKAAVTR